MASNSRDIDYANLSGTDIKMIVATDAPAVSPRSGTYRVLCRQLDEVHAAAKAVVRAVTRAQADLAEILSAAHGSLAQVDTSGLDRLPQIRQELAAKVAMYNGMVQGATAMAQDATA